PTLIVNVYNQPNQPDGDHGRTLRELDSVIQRVKAEHSSVDFLLAGDWNLHHPLWGGTEAAQARWDGADQLLSLMARHDLATTLPPGTITWRNRGRANQQSTIDFPLLSPRLCSKVQRCGTFEGTMYGS